MPFSTGMSKPPPLAVHDPSHPPKASSCFENQTSDGMETIASSQARCPLFTLQHSTVLFPSQPFYFPVKDSAAVVQMCVAGTSPSTAYALQHLSCELGHNLRIEDLAGARASSLPNVDPVQVTAIVSPLRWQGVSIYSPFENERRCFGGCVKERTNSLIKSKLLHRLFHILKRRNLKAVISNATPSLKRLPPLCHAVVISLLNAQTFYHASRTAGRLHPGQNAPPRFPQKACRILQRPCNRPAQRTGGGARRKQRP